MCLFYSECPTNYFHQAYNALLLNETTGQCKCYCPSVLQVRWGSNNKAEGERDVGKEERKGRRDGERK
jgi:hypothetical protein